MKSLKQVLILCGGKAKRLRPYSYTHSKSDLPFLNLPLLAYSWKLAEDLQNNSFLLNSHLFPEELKKTVGDLSGKDQKAEVFFEKEPLGSAGTLYALRKELKKSPYFTYINGDCLLFPSRSQKLFEFEKEFLKSQAEALLFALPIKPPSKNSSSNRPYSNARRLLYCDPQQNLIEVVAPKPKDKVGFFFTGLALFKSSLLDELKATDRDLFSDFLQPLLASKKIKVFIDEGAFFLEAGDKKSYLKSTEFCLKSLYAKKSFKKTNFVKERLQDTFQRFDPQDKTVGLNKGAFWSKKQKALLLAPESVRGLDLLKVEGFSVIAPQVRFYDKMKVKNSVLACPHSSLKGSLKEELILTKAP